FDVAGRVECRSILAAEIWCLSVDGCRIVRSVVDPKKRRVVDDRRIVVDFDRLGMARGSAAHLLVARVLLQTPGIAGDRLTDPLDRLENRLDTPETATC